MMTLKINFFAQDITADQTADFMQAINHEAANMNIQLCDDSISRLEGKIANTKGNYSPEEVQAFQKQLATVLVDSVLHTRERPKIFGRSNYVKLYNKR